MKEEKRKYVRLNAYIEVDWKRAADRAQESTAKDDRTKNISEGVICLNISEKVKVGDFLDLTIKLPNQKIIRSGSQVRWVRESEAVTKRYDVGLEFVDISSQERDEVRNFVFHLLSDQPSYRGIV
jgi:c-di-GMP-binding flagellar brake protein YcgR